MSEYKESHSQAHHSKTAEKKTVKAVSVKRNKPKTIKYFVQRHNNKTANLSTKTMEAKK